MDFVTRHQRLFFFIAAGFLFLAGGFRAWFFLAQTAYANGWDAYYYLVQLKAIVTEGRMHSADYSVVYFFLLIFKGLQGDYVMAYKLTACLAISAYPLAVFTAVYQIAGRQKLLTAILLAVLALFSPTALLMGSQFLKNLLGVVFLLFFISALPRSRWYVVLPLFVLTFFCHRLTGAVAVIFLLVQFFNMKYWKILVFAGIILVPASLFLPGILHFTDMQRFEGSMAASPQWAPWSFLQFYGTDKISGLWQGELILAMVLLCLFMVFFFVFLKKKEHRRLQISFISLSLILLCPFLVFNEEGPALRFFLMFMMLIPILPAFFADRLAGWIKILLIIIFSIGSFFSFYLVSPEDFDPPYETYQALTQSSMKHIDTSKTNMVITHRGLAEYFTFTTGLDALPWQADASENPDTIMRICYGIEPHEFSALLDSGDLQEVNRIGVMYTLLPEPLWRKFTNNALVLSDTLLLQRVFCGDNPWQTRPSFIRVRRK